MALIFLLGCGLVTVTSAQPGISTRHLAWTDLPPAVQARLTSSGLSVRTFPASLVQLRGTHERRVREGDLDHLVFYALQSRRFTALPAIEPALSAKAFVSTQQVPDDARARLHALVRALDSRDTDARLTYFRALAAEALPSKRDREAALVGEYARAMRFLYQKEFVAQRSADPANAVETLYHSRGLSTDTEVEAGYVVYLGLAIVKSLDSEERGSGTETRGIRRVLIVGPGLDLAPRTGLIEDAPPESYQPWAVIDALLALGLPKASDLEVVGADINPRVVQHLHRERTSPPTLHLITGIGETDGVTFSDDYRDYFRRLGASIGSETPARSSLAGHLAKTVSVRPDAAHALDAVSLDVVTDTIDAQPFDLVIATNILPYFDDRELTLAIANIARMLAPGGRLLHNESRASMQQICALAGLPLEQSRHAVIATVPGAPPLGDSVWIQKKSIPNAQVRNSQ